MKRSMVSSALFAACWASASPAQVSGGWQVGVENGSCSMKRPLGADGTAIGFSKSPGTDQTTLSVIGAGAAQLWRLELPKLVLHLDPGGEAPAKVDNPPRYVFHSSDVYIRSDARDFLGRVAAARTLRILLGKRVVLEQDLDGAEEAIALLRDCERVGLEAVGIDAVQRQALRAAPRPVAELVKLVKVKDYPKEAVRGGASGSVTVRLTVAASGRPERCDYISKSGHDSLDRVTCKIFMERARFRPAIGRDGQAVAAPFVTKISWRTG